jgi:hypothetical protein
MERWKILDERIGKITLIIEAGLKRSGGEAEAKPKAKP